MITLRSVGLAAIGTTLICGALWAAIRIFTAWLIPDLDEKRAAREARAARHRGNGRE